LNPAYPLFKVLRPIATKPEKVLAIAGKPIASASAALMARNEETVSIRLEGDVEGDITITTPYDQDTLEKILAISLIPQLALLSTAYAIPEVQRDLNVLWRAGTLGRAGNLPRWNATRDLLGRRIKKEAAESVATKTATNALARGATPRVAAQLGSRAAGSFIAGVNIVVWIDTAILAITGVADLLIDEETEESLGINITPYSPLGDVIGSMIGWVSSTLGIQTDRIVQVGQELGLDALAKGGLFMLGDLVLDVEATTIDVNLAVGDQTIDLDLDGRTFGEVMGLALQFATLDEATSIEWSDRDEMMKLFIILVLSFVIVVFGRGLIKWLKGSRN
jgi:hypothetical protein